MAAPAFLINRPDYDSTGKGVDLDGIRDNFVWMLNQAVEQGYLLGWTTTTDYTGNEINWIQITSGSVKIRREYSWSSGQIQTIVHKFDKGLGAGLETLTGGTVTFSFDANGNFTGATSA